MCFNLRQGGASSESTLDSAKVGQVSELGKKCVQFVHFFFFPSRRRVPTCVTVSLG